MPLPVCLDLPRPGVYCTTKWALRTMTNVMRTELLPLNIDVVAAIPGELHLQTSPPASLPVTENRLCGTRLRSCTRDVRPRAVHRPGLTDFTPFDTRGPAPGPPAGFTATPMLVKAEQDSQTTPSRLGYDAFFQRAMKGISLWHHNAADPRVFARKVAQTCSRAGRPPRHVAAGTGLMLAFMLDLLAPGGSACARPAGGRQRPTPSGAVCVLVCAQGTRDGRHQSTLQAPGAGVGRRERDDVADPLTVAFAAVLLLRASTCSVVRGAGVRNHVWLLATPGGCAQSDCSARGGG